MDPNLLLLAVAGYRMVLDVTDERSRGRLTGIYTAGSFFAGACSSWGLWQEMQPKSRGMASVIQRRMSHISVILG